MKKTILYTTVGLFLFLNQACKKTTTGVSDVNETVNATVNANESYTYTLSNDAESEAFNIQTASARSAEVSIVSNDNTSTFVYTPSQNTSGTDVIVVTSQADSQNTHGECGGHRSCEKVKGSGELKPQGKGHHRKKHCNKGSTRNVTFNITVNATQN